MRSGFVTVKAVFARLLLSATFCGQLCAETPEYYLHRPEVEKAYGYSQAVKVGPFIKVSGTVSMDDEGKPVAAGDMEQQVINIYANLREILAHFGLGFDNVVVENVFTTDMAGFVNAAEYRKTIYTDNFPTATWLEVTSLASPDFLVEIAIEAVVQDR